MNNYQIYSTNVLLGGQMKYDLILNRSDDNIYVSDFHITPISDNVPYNKLSQDSLLNYSHLENIKSYYKSIEGSFYEKFIPPALNHSWPIISDDPTAQKPYDDTYMMGCKRMKYYTLYDKQFEFLCPVWIEKLSGALKFKIIIKDSSGKTLTTRILQLKSGINDYHNKFVRYFDDFVKTIGLLDGDSNVININLFKKTGSLVGISAEDGNIYQKDINNIVETILDRERPLIEVDSMIIDCFKNSHMIIKQLINFNLCFNLSDIISEQILAMMSVSRFCVEVEVGDDAGWWPGVDFYNNYEMIRREVCGGMNVVESFKRKTYIKNDISTEEYNTNVLNYLKDGDCIDFRDKNKFSPMIVHWSLKDNPEYIFNVYDGFSGVNTDGSGGVIYNTGLYGDSVNPFQPHYSPNANNIAWANNVEISNITQFNEFFKNLIETSNYYSTVFGGETGGGKWVNNIKYNTIGDEGTVNVILFYINNIDTMNEILQTKGGLLKEISSQVYIYTNKELLFIISDNPDNLTFKNIYDMIKKKNGVDENINILWNVLSKYVQPITIIFNRTIEPSIVDGPSKEVTEIEYYKNDSSYSYIFRYDGDLRPTFKSISGPLFNYLYYKDVVSEADFLGKKTIYSKYSATGFLPLYKSIGYYPIKNTWKDGREYMIDYGSRDFVKSIYKGGYECKWYNTGMIYNLIKDIEFVVSIDRDEDEEPDFEMIIKDYIRNTYSINDSVGIDFIYNNYNITYDFDYQSDTDINKYIFNIKLSLK